MSCSLGSARRSTTWSPSGGSRRSFRMSARWDSGSSTASRTRSPCTGCPAWTDGCPGRGGRVPTFLVTVDAGPAEEVASRLAADQIGVWAHDSWYSLDLYPRLGYTGKAVRIGFIHYNPPAEVDRLLTALESARH